MTDQPARPALRGEPIQLAGRLCALAAAAYLCAQLRADPDLWGHLRFGLDVIATGRLTSIDPYSFTQDVAWINHEWLSEFLTALAWRVGGVAGLVALKSAIVGSTVWLLYGLVRRAAPQLRWWLLAATLVALTPAATTARPQLWTLLCLAGLARVMAGDVSVWLAVPLFGAWANLHGGWTVGAGVAGMWLAGRALDSRLSITALRTPALALATGAGATLVTPYGWDLWRFVAATVRTGRDITEWKPLWQQPDVSHALLWLLTSFVVGATIARRRSRLPLERLFPAVCLGVMGAFVDRVAPLYAVVALGLAAALSPMDSSDQRDEAAASAARPAGAWIVDGAVVAAVWLVFAGDVVRCLPVRGTWAPDLAAASAFETSSARGNLVLPFNWGEYAIWHWGPRLRVSIDGRRETIYSDRVLRTQADAARGGVDGLEFLANERPEYVWLPNDTGAHTADWLRAHGYRMDIVTSRSFVATRADLAPLASGLAPVSACFP